MRERNLNSAQVEEALRNSYRDYLAKPLKGVRPRSRIYVGRSGGREIRVYVKPGTNPVWIRTVV